MEACILPRPAPPIRQDLVSDHHPFQLLLYPIQIGCRGLAVDLRGACMARRSVLCVGSLQALEEASEGCSAMARSQERTHLPQKDAVVRPISLSKIGNVFPLVVRWMREPEHEGKPLGMASAKYSLYRIGVFNSYLHTHRTVGEMPYAGLKVLNIQLYPMVLVVLYKSEGEFCPDVLAIHGSPSFFLFLSFVCFLCFG